ncbi:MAG: hypothetical protein ABFS34_01135 [Gemmatimonadota bacterium]
MRFNRVLGAVCALGLVAALWTFAAPFAPPAITALYAESAPPRLPQPAAVQPIVSGTSLLVAWESAGEVSSFEVVVRHPAGGTTIPSQIVHGASAATFDVGDVNFRAGPYCVQVRSIPGPGQEDLASPFTDCAPVASFVCNLDWQVEAVPGALEVVVFGSARTDVASFDPRTFRLGDGGQGGTPAFTTRLADIGGAGGADGYRDLVARFDLEQMRRNGDFSFETAAFYLQAMTRGGSPACGSLGLQRSG